MGPWFVGALAAGAAAPGAVLLRRRLRAGRHRHPEEVGLPARGHDWILVALPVAALLVGHGVTAAQSPGVGVLYCMGLPVLAALTAIDLDVHRLPNVLTYPLVPLAVVVTGSASACTGQWFGLLRAVVAGAALGVAYLLLLIVSPGGAGLGLGDVKLAVGLGVLLGWFSWSSVLGATIAGFVLGGLWAGVLLLTRRAARHSHIAFGPFMIGGVVLTLLAP